MESPFGDQEQQGLSTGTGFVVSDEGFIVTNAHVVLGARRATVTFGEDREIEAEIKGVDLNSDLAVLKVDPKDHKLESLALGTAKELRVGDPVVAIGNPFGLDRTLTTGVVSALARKIQGLNGFTISNVVQTDAAINKGNSGGPLLDAQGRVIGVNSQIQTESGGNVGIGFAVPVDKLKEVLPTLEDGKEVQVAFLGVTTVPIDAQRAKVVKVREGLLIAAITPKSPAQKAGLKAGDSGVTFDVDGSPVDLGGDIILKVDGKVFDTRRRCRSTSAGSTWATTWTCSLSAAVNASGSRSRWQPVPHSRRRSPNAPNCRKVAAPRRPLPYDGAKWQQRHASSSAGSRGWRMRSQQPTLARGQSASSCGRLGPAHRLG